jgi:hypothetical protein
MAASTVCRTAVSSALSLLLRPSTARLPTGLTLLLTRLRKAAMAAACSAGAASRGAVCARKFRVASLSITAAPSTTSTGTSPLGFSLRNHSGFPLEPYCSTRMNNAALQCEAHSRSCVSYQCMSLITIHTLPIKTRTINSSDHFAAFIQIGDLTAKFRNCMTLKPSSHSLRVPGCKECWNYSICNILCAGIEHGCYNSYTDYSPVRSPQAHKAVALLRALSRYAAHTGTSCS